MKRMTGEQIFASMNNLEPALLAEAMPRSWVEAGSGQRKRRPRLALARWLETGWAAAVLSVAVAGAVLTGIIIAGRMGTADAPAGTEETAETDLADYGPPYSLSFHAGGDGTATAEIVVNDRACALYDVVIPETSPNGDTVVGLTDTFTHHTLVPPFMTADCFERYIQGPLEEHYGLTLEAAETLIDYEELLSGDLYLDPRYDASFRLRSCLACYMHQTPAESAGMLAVYPELGLDSVATDMYWLELPTDEEVIRALHDILIEAGFTAEKWEEANRELVRMATQPGDFSPEVNLSAGIRTVTLPATLTSLPTDMFDEWIDLEKIIYGGTADDWWRITNGQWFARVPVECADRTIGVWESFEETTNETETDEPQPELPVSPTTVVLTLSDERQYTVSGAVHWATELWNNAFVSADMEYPSLEELIAEGDLPALAASAGDTLTVYYEQKKDWTYTLSATVYDTDQREILRGIPPDELLQGLTVGNYYVELLVKAIGPYLAEPDGHEDYGACFTFVLSVTE